MIAAAAGVLAVLLGLALAVALVAPVRVDAALDAATDDAEVGASVTVRVRWLFVSWRSGAPPAGRKPRRRKVRPPKPRRPGRGAARARTLLRTRGLVTRVLRLIQRLRHVLRPTRAEGWVRFGFEDPALTGTVFGAAQALTALPGAVGRAVAVEPDFGGAVLAARVRLSWSVRPGSVLWPVGCFLGSPVTWRAGWRVLRAR